MATATLVKFTLDAPQIYGRNISIIWNEPLNAATARQITTMLQELDGVQYAEPEGGNRGLSITLIKQFVDAEEIARVAFVLVNNVLNETDPVVVRTVFRQNGPYSVLETDYLNTDTRLRQALQKLDLYNISFDNGGYNISFMTDTIFDADLASRIKQTVTDFYAGTLPKRPLDYLRDDAPGDNFFKWSLNRRLTPDQCNTLSVQLLSAVPGLFGLYFENNGHEIKATTANQFFRKNRVAMQVIALVEDFFDEIDAAA